MASRLSITQADLLEALAAAQQSTAPEDAQTIHEMAKATGVSEKKVRLGLLALQGEGRLAVHRVYRTGLDGRQANVPGYTIRPRR